MDQLPKILVLEHEESSVELDGFFDLPEALFG
jgi:hypothetical protein